MVFLFTRVVAFPRRLHCNPCFLPRLPPMAAVAALKEQLSGLLNSMLKEELLDDQFSQLQMVQDPSCPGFVAEVITLFCQDAERMLTELTTLLSQSVVDYQKIDAHVHQLRGSSSSVGAQKIKQGCAKLRSLCEDQDEEGCQRALEVVKHDYLNLRSKFGTMFELEQRIRAYDSKPNK